ncbi:crossover junction endodeoxyribonuclease RuvC [Candidatus Binatia bacterium]|nr:crossover junction endodeoxyribonuclease RuvC [Candidatus Binatia bacterium]
MRVLGLDPGTVATGWGVVDDAGTQLRFVAGGVVRAAGSLPERLARIFDGAADVLATYRPACISLEKTFVGENVQSAFRLGEARGAILVAAARAGVPVSEYSPAEIKVAVAGQGRAAKDQMQVMVGRLLGLSAAIPSDEADALAAAICHLHTSRFAAHISSATARDAAVSRSAATRSARNRVDTRRAAEYSRRIRP